MPEIKSITSVIAENREVFWPNDVIRGHWEVDVQEPFAVRAVRVSCFGAALTKWTTGPDSKDALGFEKFVDMEQTVLGHEAGQKGPDVKIPHGINTFQFSFQLPEDGLPSSFEGQYGAVRYWLKLEIVRRTIFQSHIKRYRVFTVLDRVDINHPTFQPQMTREVEHKVSKLFGLGAAGKVHLHVQTDRTGYCPGESIAVSLTAQNKCDKDFGQVSATLYQRIVYMANATPRVRDSEMNSISGGSLLKGRDVVWTNEFLHVDAIPPSTRIRTCQVIVVSYYIVVKIGRPLIAIGGSDIKVNVPVVIGTIPYGHTDGEVPAGANAISSAEISFARYSKGFFEFSKENKNKGAEFPKLNYRPLCAFNEHFEFVPSEASQSQSKCMKANSLSMNDDATAYPALMPTSLPAEFQLSTSMEDLPGLPTYEEAMASENHNTTTTACRTNGFTSGLYPAVGEAENEISDLELPHYGSCVLLWFELAHCTQVLQLLQGNMDVLRRHEGQIIAFSPQVVVNSGSWQELASLGIFAFSNEESASMWLSTVKQQALEIGISLQDACMLGCIENPDPSKSVFNLSVLKSKGKATPTMVEEMEKLGHMKAMGLRKQHNGTLLVSQEKLAECGALFSSGEYVVLTQWKNLNELIAYKHALKSPDLHAYTDSTEKCYKLIVSLMFLSVDLESLGLSTENNGQRGHPHGAIKECFATI